MTLEGEPKKDGQASVIFIHSRLDDYGLLPAPFRIVCGIGRRGVCYESIPNLARRMRLSKNTVRKGLKHLTERGIITATKRQGRTTEYAIAPLSAWAEPLPNEGRGAKRKGSPTKRGEGYPYQTRVDKGYPIEVTPKKGESPPNPKPLLKERGERESRGPKLLPRELEKEEERLKGELSDLPADSPHRKAVHAKLAEVEIERHGYVKTAVDFNKYRQGPDHSAGW